MKIVITDGAGFIGSHLGEALIARGDEVFILDNFTSGKRENVPPEANFWENDIGTSDYLSSYFESIRPHVVVHAAASMKDPDNWVEDVQTNVIGTINVINACKEFNIPRLVYLQTSLCYGFPQEQPITLNHPINPTKSSYPISKTAAERYIQMSELDYVSFRLANCYGPRNLSGPFATFYRELTGGRLCTVVDAKRDFVYITDLIRVLLRGIDGIGEGVYHVSSGVENSILKVYDLVSKELGIIKDPILQPRGIDDVPTLLLDSTRTTEDFGIKPEVLLEEGIIETIKWYQEHGVGETYTHLRGLDGERQQ